MFEMTPKIHKGDMQMKVFQGRTSIYRIKLKQTKYLRVNSTHFFIVEEDHSNIHKLLITCLVVT